jgi:hypothetical protein
LFGFPASARASRGNLLQELVGSPETLHVGIPEDLLVFAHQDGLKRECCGDNDAVGRVVIISPGRWTDFTAILLSTGM